MPERPSVRLDNRTLLGKRVRQLRRRGIVPVNLVAPGSASRALQVGEREIVNIIKQVGHTGIVQLQLADSADVALIGELDINPLTQRLRHVAFRKVDLAKPIEVAVPVELTGAAPAEQAKDRFVVQVLQQITIRSLPDAIPHSVQVDVSMLDNAGDAVRVRDLQAAAGLEILDDPDTIIVQVAQERAEVEAVAAPEVAVEGEEQPAAEGAAGEAESEE